MQFGGLYVFLTLLTKKISNEWVEITQSKNTDFPILESTPSIQRPVVFTTTSNYETLMRTAYSTDVLTPTPPKISRRNGYIMETTTFRPDNVLPRSTISKIKGNNTGNVHRIHYGNVQRVKTNKNNINNNKKKKIEAKVDDAMEFDKFIPLMKSIQENLLKNEGKSVISKISILKNLRDTILMNLNEKISNLWLPQDVNREARGYKDDHYMEFPSNEGALMTIGFLTFAVFLIKLVLKLIYALKYKKEYYSTSTTTTTVATLFIRKRRDIEEEENNRILQLIEEFRLD